jgi:hypothetical protein
MKELMTAKDRRALVAVVRERYQAGDREEKTRILEEFGAISGYHRKSAIRLLNSAAMDDKAPSSPSLRTVYDHAVRGALQVLWEASDRVCSKRLKALIPTLVPALERHGHLQLDPLVRRKLLAISAASIDRLLRDVRSGGKRNRPKRAPSAATRRVPVRTFADWDSPQPGYMEMDLVAHCGQAVVGSFVHTLTLTDVASGWTECVPLLVREAALVRDSVDALRSQLPFTLRGLDVDNGTEFVNDTLLAYCQTHTIEFTRSRPYHKNDQAWVEQKNGSVVRRLVGYRRLVGVAAADALQQLYRASRLFVNFFQPSFQLKEKVRIGGRISKRYHPPQTPCARLLASDAVSEAIKAQLQATSEQLDPLALLDGIRYAQRQLALIADGQKPAPNCTRESDLDHFLASLTDAWRDGEVRPTHQAEPKKVRHWRTRKNPFEEAWPQVLHWLEDEPEQTAKVLLERLQHAYPGAFPDGQLRTLQRRVKAWRRDMARRLVFPIDASQPGQASDSITANTRDPLGPVAV